MARRERVKKILIIIVIGIFLVVTFGTSVMFFVGNKQQEISVNPDEVQPTITTGAEESNTGMQIKVEQTTNTGIISTGKYY